PEEIASMKRHDIRILIVLAVMVACAAGSSFAIPTDKAIVQAVMQDYDLNPEEYTIEVLSNRLKTRLIDPEDLSFRAFSKRDPIGPYTIYVTITDEGECIEKGQVRLRINRHIEVLVACDKIKRHTLFVEELFEKKMMDITSLREQPVSSIEDILDYRSKRNLRKGDILTTGDMESVPDIEVGGEVTIVYNDGLCEVRVPGKVLQTGRSGETVRIKNKASGKIVSARVVDSRIVSVDP
ncbi:MAG: flagella basal body P-ring formation protein FlgA, partial [Candidatus Zixiibacteriota bacterium]